MAILKNAMNKLTGNGNAADSESQYSSSSSLSMGEIMHYESNATRWEKTLVGADAIVAQVTKFDPDGVDVVVVGGGLGAIGEEESDFTADCACAESSENGKIEWHRGVKNTKGLEAKIASQDPVGPCYMGKAMEQVLDEALEGKDLRARPCSVLVLTAGKPDDAERLEEALQGAAEKVRDRGGQANSPLSVTFIQVGKDKEASRYLRYLDKKMTASASDGNDVDIVDAMSYDEIKDTMDAMKAEAEKSKKKGSNGKNGAIIGAFAGAAVGLGGMYLYNKKVEKKRIKSGSWAGKWRCFYEKEEIAVLDVADDKEGSITIEGLQDTMTGSYYAEEEEGEFWIRFTDPCGEVVEGEFDEENFVLTWSDGTRWEAVNKTQHWSRYAGAATVGAAAFGAAGYAADKKFFNKIQKEDQCDYVIVVDRSAAMALTDSNNCSSKKR